MKNINLTNILIALVWFINGLFCKVLNLVPRHKEIVSKITTSQYSKELTILIGFSEILMTLWILSRIKPKLNALVQIAIIVLMNIIEFILVPHLLMWGKFNGLFALLLITIIYLNNFIFNKTTKLSRYAFNS
ncbi:DoxX-like family protein [Algibacter sp. AS12]|uniref:DoxX-like family protein n=1 Tax=Algibacter sp. AS12 TaxID=3135773 RepID=UPI00398A7B4D